MAIMIPSVPLEIPEHSREDEMFDALGKLSDDYYVFHSFRLITNDGNIIHESETDFVIFHKNKGIMCIEAKAGAVKCQNDTWFYQSGIEMKHGGPFKQADLNKWKLSKYFEKVGLSDLLHKCKLTHAVWFPSISKTTINQINMPIDGDKNIVLSSEDLSNPSNAIERIFDFDFRGQLETTLTDNEANKIINSVLCPSFDLLPLKSAVLDHKRNIYGKMLKEQSNILNFLEEQPFAAISGVAGTGKTLIAVEKARRHAVNGDNVLFLCFNKYLCNHLRRNYHYENVHYYTIDGFACSICHSKYADFDELETRLIEMSYSDSFPYKHIIVDEGQDFGQKRIEEANILDILETIVLDEGIDGTYYVFYDKNQLIQGYNVPKSIEEADCKLTLYKNCRNTENIAITSMRPLKEAKRPKMFSGCITGESPKIFISNEKDKQIEFVNNSIRILLNQKIQDIVILTCSTEENSILSNKITDGKYSTSEKQFKFTTCRKFKGLEADAVILVDVQKDNLIGNDTLVFYVGASRARFNLIISANLTNDDCEEIVDNFKMSHIGNINKKIAAKLNSLLAI